MQELTLTPPHVLFQNQVDVLLSSLPAARDADVESVHLARVATRRIREALPLFMRNCPKDVDRIKYLIKRAGRRLGRVRELDVMEEGLVRRAMRLPSAMHAIGVARRQLDRERNRARRRLVKVLDGLALDREEKLRLSQMRHGWHLFRRDSGYGWEPVLRYRIGDRADGLRDTVNHATRVYFPNRLHQVRIAAKKLRYSLELAQQSGLWRPLRVLGDLKRAQDALGRVHDAQVLFDATDELMLDSGVDARQTQLLKDDLEGEIAERHAEYLELRDRLREICNVCREYGARPGQPHRSVRTPLIAASALAVPAGLLVLGARAR